MLRGESRRLTPVGRGLAYPVVVLLVSVFAAGCGGGPEPAGRPSFVGAPDASPTSAAPSAAPSGAAGTTAPATPVPPTATGGPAPVKTGLRYVFPVQTGNVAFHPTHSAYPATDIFANCGSPVVAVTDGRILEVSRVDKFDKGGEDGPLNGGKSVSLLGDDGVRYYGSHLVEVTAGIEAGVRVRAGQRVGSVGRTGNANNVCHLHFGISPPCGPTGDWWIRRGVVWPADFLTAWRKKINKSPAGTVSAWHRDRGCPKAP